MRFYCHVGTGNYNSKTARLYEDFGLLTADPKVGDDLSQLFNYLTGYARNIDYERLLVAPHSLGSGLVDLVRQERAYGAAGRITMKMNSLVDPDMIDELYAASADGVQVDLVVRGICCLRPQVPGLSENIRVRSIVGRYLEHSRIYRFANGAGPGEPVLLIGSADLMPRNLDRRVEALVEVVSEPLRQQVEDVLDVELADDSLAWELSDAVWQPVDRRHTLETHLELQERAAKRAVVELR